MGDTVRKIGGSIIENTTESIAPQTGEERAMHFDLMDFLGALLMFVAAYFGTKHGTQDGR